MDAEADAHEADALRRAADGWTAGAESATRWARMKRRAATLLHKSAEATAEREQARREHARKDAHTGDAEGYTRPDLLD